MIVEVHGQLRAQAQKSFLTVFGGLLDSDVKLLNLHSKAINFFLLLIDQGSVLRPDVRHLSSAGAERQVKLLFLASKISPQGSDLSFKLRNSIKFKSQGVDLSLMFGLRLADLHLKS